MEPTQPEFGKTNLTFWLSERVYKTHNVIYVIALLAWAAAVAFVSARRPSVRICFPIPNQVWLKRVHRT